MRGGTNTKGYTVVEVMVFLVISGFMFIIAAGFINGKQAKAEFRQGMNDINSQVQQAINDVSNGIYPSNGDFACTADNLGGTPALSSGSNVTGTNKGCTFIGKVIQFGVDNPTGISYNIYSIVGRQFQTDDKSFLPPIDLAHFKPVAATGAGGSTDLTQRATLKWGLHVDQMYNGTTPIGAFGIFAGLPTATTDTSTGDTHLDSGAAAVAAIAIPGTQLGQGTAAIDAQVIALPSLAPTIDIDPDIIVCFRGGDNQFGRLTIGTTDNVHSQKLTSHIQISDGVPSAGCPS